jgi:hypothetical protein
MECSLKSIDETGKNKSAVCCTNGNELLPPSLQQGAQILISEGLYTLCTARNKVTFEKRQHNNSSVRDLFMRRAKSRQKTEWSLLGKGVSSANFGSTIGGSKITAARSCFYSKIPLYNAYTIH